MKVVGQNLTENARYDFADTANKVSPVHQPKHFFEDVNVVLSVLILLFVQSVYKPT